jgi:hypothetical protein
MQHDPKFHRSDVLNDQVPERRRVILKSTLTIGGTCQVKRVRPGRGEDEVPWEEVGEEFEANGGPMRFEGTYDEDAKLYGLVERWPDSKKWEFYQIDVRCPGETDEEPPPE